MQSSWHITHTSLFLPSHYSKPRTEKKRKCWQISFYKKFEIAASRTSQSELSSFPPIGGCFSSSSLERLKLEHASRGSAIGPLAGRPAAFWLRKLLCKGRLLTDVNLMLGETSGRDLPQFRITHVHGRDRSHRVSHNYN